MHILLIDDEPVLFQDILKACDYHVDVATNGYDGLKRLRTNDKPYELIILDLKMPLLNGLEVLREIRSDQNLKHLFVVLLTANTTEDSLVEGLSKGADLYLTKPISPSSFISQIKALDRRFEMEKQRAKDAEASEDTQLAILTPRENQIMLLIGDGYPNKLIARQLGLSETTVKNHTSNIYRKMDVTNRTEAAAFFKRKQPVNL